MAEGAHEKKFGVAGMELDFEDWGGESVAIFTVSGHHVEYGYCVVGGGGEDLVTVAGPRN